jgi:UPF0271 protein
LYNLSAVDKDLARAIARAVVASGKALVLFALSGSALLEAGRAAGLRVAAEAFADRAYTPGGTLLPRSVPGAVIDDIDLVVSRGVELVRHRIITAVDGTRLQLEADTICLHGDTSNAGQLAAALRAGLEAAGIAVRPVGGA